MSDGRPLAGRSPSPKSDVDLVDGGEGGLDVDAVVDLDTDVDKCLSGSASRGHEMHGPSHIDNDIEAEKTAAGLYANFIAFSVRPWPAILNAYECECYEHENNEST